MNSFDKSNHSYLRWELMALVFVSVLMHLGGLWMLGLNGSAGTDLRGEPEKPSDLKSTVVVRFFVSGVTKFEPRSILDEAALSVTDLKTDSVTNSTTESLSHGDIAQVMETYSPSGRLTRLPSPVNDIDLNNSEIDEAAVAGVIELTVLVKSDGTVADVSTFVQDNRARQFADLIAGRFLRARFFPGEIDGKAVNSEFKVTVVSEPISTLSEHS